MGEAPAVDQDRAEDGLLGLEVVGQQLLRVGGHGVVSSVRGGGGPARRGTWLRVSAGTPAPDGPSPGRPRGGGQWGPGPGNRPRPAPPGMRSRGCARSFGPLVLHRRTSRFTRSAARNRCGRP